MRHFVPLTLILLASCTSHAGLIIQQASPVSPIVPGDVATFDLLIDNGTAATTWQNINIIGPLDFILPSGFSFGPGTFNGFTTVDGWLPLIVPISISSPPGFELQISASQPAGSTVNLAPTDDPFRFAQFSVLVPDDFAGTFDLKLNRTINLGTPAGGDASNGWDGDPSIPIGLLDLPAPPTGGNPGEPFGVSFTAVPEPSPFLLLGLVSCLIGGSRVLRPRVAVE